MKRTNTQIIIGLTILALAGLVPCAAAQQKAIISDGKTIVAHKGSPAQTVAVDETENSLVRIFDNIGTAYPKGTFWCCEGATVSGPNTPGGFEWWDGAAFTPAANHVVTKVGLALGYVSGTNKVVVSVNEDANGVPGKALKTWIVKNLPNDGTCCTLTKVTDEAGIPVTGGVQYWVTVTTNKNDEDVWAAWNVNDTDQIDPAPGASRCQGSRCRGNGQWQSFQTAPGLAFEVLGK